MSTTLKYLLVGEDKSASSALKHVGDQAEKTHGVLSKMSHIAGGVFGGEVLTAATEKVTDFLKESVHAAIEEQQDQARLELALRNTTHASDEQIKSADELLGKMSEQSGVAKDLLEPAYQRLVQATGSLKQGHHELSLAMDISAGTGKSLDAVSMALAKAQMGNVGALGRLGIQTKDTAGKTEDLDTVLKNAANTFKGQAEAKAHSFAGEMGRLHNTVDELQKKVGAHLIPVLTNLSDWFINTGLPAIEDTGTKISDSLAPAVHDAAQAFKKLEPAAKAVGEWAANNVGTIAKVAAGYLAINAAVRVAQAGVAAYSAIVGTVTAITTAWNANNAILAVRLFAINAAEIVVAATTKAWAAAQWLLNAAMDANPIGIAVVAIAALAAGLVYAYKHSETFRNAVNAVGRALKTAGEAVLHFAGQVKDAIGTALTWVKGHWLTIVGFLTGPIGIAVTQIIQHWDGIKAALGKVVGWFKALPGKITDALGDAGTMLSGVGHDIVTGLETGISKAWHFVTDKLHSLVNAIPKAVRKLLGIASPSKVMAELGKFTVEGFAQGLASSDAAIDKAIGKVTGKVKAAAQKLADDMSKWKDAQGSMGGFVGTLFLGQNADGGPPTLSDILGNGANLAAQAVQYAADLRQAISMGLSKTSLTDLQSQGAGGASALHAIVGGGAGAIAQVNAYEAQQAAAYNAAGTDYANALYGSQVGKDLGTLTLDLHLNARDQQKMLLKLKRENGGLSLGLA